MAKLNFWQWLGVALLIVGITLYVMRKIRERDAKPKSSFNHPAVTTPAAPAVTTG